MNFLNALLLAGETAPSTNASQPQQMTGFAAFMANYGGIVFLVLMIVVMYFLMIRPQKKKQKAEQEMRNNLRVGDELTTIGGVCGRVVSIKDDTVTIESGTDRSKLQFKKWAIQSVETKHEVSVDDDDDDDDDDI